jgi:HSP20 family protein
MAKSDLTTGSGRSVQRSTDVFAAMRDEMDRMFERFEQGWPRRPSLFARDLVRADIVPELDVRDDGKQVTIEVDLPGVTEKDVSVTLANGVLTIKGERKSEREEKKDSYYLAERSYGSFERALRIPETIDDRSLEAKFDKGVLRIVAQKRPEAVKAERRIEIKAG